jgi:hypothetical protein
MLGAVVVATEVYRKLIKVRDERMLTFRVDERPLPQDQSDIRLRRHNPTMDVPRLHWEE